MRDQSASEENSTASLEGLPSSRAPWRVASAEVLGDFVLSVQFLDGLRGTVDLASLVASPGAGVFAELRDKKLFDSVKVQGGVVTWPNGLDLAPDAMYRAIQQSGLFRPQPEIAA
jgi:hypothetical protein